MWNGLWTKSFVCGIIVLMVGASAVSAFYGNPSIGSKPMDRGNWFYVGGSGPGNYTNIQSAIDASSNGDTIFVYDDSSPYYEHITINTAINLIGEEKNTTVIDAINSTVNPFIEINANMVNISGFTFQNCGGGQYTFISISSDYNIISNNLFFHNDIVLDLDLSNHNIIFGNYLNDCYYAGILMHCSNDTLISNNIIQNVGHEGISIGSSTRNNLTENTISSCLHAIQISNCNHILITNNTLHDNYGCMILGNSNYNYIIENNIIPGENTNFLGIGLDGSSFNFITNNHIESRYYWDYPITGIIFSSQSENNTICENTILNWNYSIFEYYWSPYGPNNNNKIFHNNFINNTNQPSENSSNTWDDGYPSGGNYWDDYNGSDNYYGINQNKPGHDGIGDIPYNISPGHNQDQYPVMNLNGWIHNIPAVPNSPIGQEFGLLGVRYSFATQGIDPENHSLFYKWDWDDGTTSDWLGPYDSGIEVNASHVWEEGSYEIRVKVKDVYDLESDWSEPFIIEIVQLKTAFFLGSFENISETEDIIMMQARSFIVFPSDSIFNQGGIIVISKDYLGYLGASFTLGVGGVAVLS